MYYYVILQHQIFKRNLIAQCTCVVVWFCQKSIYIKKKNVNILNKMDHTEFFNVGKASRGPGRGCEYRERAPIH